MIEATRVGVKHNFFFSGKDMILDNIEQEKSFGGGGATKMGNEETDRCLF